MRTKLSLTSTVLALFLFVHLAHANDIKFLDPQLFETWSRLHVIDPFDDSEIGRGIGYISKNSENVSVLRAEQENQCFSSMIISFPSSRLSTTQSMKRSQATTSSMFEGTILEDDSEKPDPIKVSFNFKKEGEEDVKMMDLTFEDSEADELFSERISLKFPGESWTDPQQKKLFTAFQNADEVRVKSSVYGYTFNLKITMTDYKEYWDWMAELCEDKHSDPKTKKQEDNAEKSVQNN